MTTLTANNATEAPPLPTPDGRRYAFFFDVDGTLAEIQPQPDAVTLPPAVRANLRALSAACGGALALVSGRPIEQIDRLAAPLKLPLAGVHGAERRDGMGNLQRVELPTEVAASLRQTLEHEMAAMPGALLEAKGAAFALHYRQAMPYRQRILRLAASAAARFPQLTLQPGKCVVEIKPRATDKGAAINAFMRETPFCGRTPVFVGDDLTDESGFLAVNAVRGISIKVGEGSSHARYRLSRVADVHRWLEQLLLQQENIGKELRL
ncbi:trehalose-phosphatase [Brenneria populi subsp. brevivirga]|uniref:trehalose-phosphatase n=1 Tax=Brenneria populi TaxID=1505588 RepID=UPI002E193B81|nr:trehalose-phosphatase [Brenneria populi subsp. brevivirga]